MLSNVELQLQELQIILCNFVLLSTVVMKSIYKKISITLYNYQSIIKSNRMFKSKSNIFMINYMREYPKYNKYLNYISITHNYKRLSTFGAIKKYIILEWR